MKYELYCLEEREERWNNQMEQGGPDLEEMERREFSPLGGEIYARDDVGENG